MPDQENKWRRPVSSVAAAGGPKWRIPESVRAALHDAPIQLIERPLRDADGSVPAEVADADILISGGAVIDDAVLDQLHNVRFLLRPYVGYDDIDVDAVTRHGIVFADYFATALAELTGPDSPAAHGLLEVTPDVLRVTPRGRLFVRNIAMAFDRYLRHHTEERPTFSRTV